jgi:hypothetical protein
VSQPPSDDESKAKPAMNGTRRQRAASRGQRDKVPPKEPEEPEVEAPEVVNGRKERIADRRKGDGKCREKSNDFGVFAHTSNSRIRTRDWISRKNGAERA